MKRLKWHFEKLMVYNKTDVYNTQGLQLVKKVYDAIIKNIKNVEIDPNWYYMRAYIKTKDFKVRIRFRISYPTYDGIIMCGIPYSTVDIYVKKYLLDMWTKFSCGSGVFFMEDAPKTYFKISDILHKIGDELYKELVERGIIEKVPKVIDNDIIERNIEEEFAVRKALPNISEYHY